MEIKNSKPPEPIKEEISLFDLLFLCSDELGVRLKAMTSEEGAASNLHYDQSSRGPLTAHDGASE